MAFAVKHRGRLTIQYKWTVGMALVLLCAVFLGGCGGEDGAAGGSEDSGPLSMAESVNSAAEEVDTAQEDGADGEPVIVAEEAQRLVSYSGNGVVLAGVPYINQYEYGYPSGCECVSAVMMLRNSGVPISVSGFLSYLDLDDAPYYDGDGYLVGGNPNEAFLGDPRTDYGWGCNSGPIARAMEEASGLHIERIDNVPLETLCADYIDNGIPVMVWATMYMEEPSISETWTAKDGTEVVWVYPNHALVLIGYDENSYYFNDSLEGAYTGYGRAETERAYNGRGMQAIVVGTTE